MRHRLRLDALRALVARSAISQNHWAIRLGLSRGHWSDLLSGKHPYPSARTRTRLLEVFDAAEDELFESEHEGTPPEESRARQALGARYEFLREIGRGATGVVFEVQDRRLGRVVAIKLVQAEAVAGVGTEQLLTELGRASKLTHPNILPIHDAGVEHGHPYVVMPRVRDGSLRQLLEREVRLPLHEALPILEGVARGLAFAHSRQLLHCDVKPENILVEEGHAYLTDFGISRRLEAEADEWASLRGSAGYSAGTPAYVSPEQASGDPIDHRSDVFSLACVAYEVLAGRLPFTGRNTQEIVSRRFHAAPPPLRDTAPDVPQAVADVITRAMDLSPHRRPDTAIAFVRELRAAAHGSRALARVAVAATRVISRLTSRLGVAGPARLRLPISDMLDDLRYTTRALRRDWRFSLNVVASLGLGLGVGLPAIGVADHIFLRPPPGIREPERVVRLVKRWETNGQVFHGTSMTGSDLVAQSEARSFTGIAASFARPLSLGRGPDARPTTTLLVSGNYFSLLGVRTVLGRPILPEDDRDGSTDGPVVLAYGFWQREYEGDRQVLGRTIELGGSRYTIVGVAEEEFNGVGLGQIELIVPLRVAARLFMGNSDDLFTGDRNAWIQLFGRLADGVGPEAAATESNVLYKRPGTYIRDRERTNVLLWESIIPGRSHQGGVTYQLALWVSGGSLLLLLLVSANLVNLFVARAAARSRQTAIRIALGGRTRQLLRTHLLEALVIGIGGAIAGLMIATPATGVVRAMVLPNVVWARGVLDFRLVAIAIAIALGAGSVAAVVALLHSRRVAPADLLRSAGGGRGGIGRGARAVRAAMIVAQAAVFAMLLALSTAFVTSVFRATAVDHGFQEEGLLFLTIPDLQRDRKAEDRKVAEVAEALAAEPGVVSVSRAYMVPWWNNSNDSVYLGGAGSGDARAALAWSDEATHGHLQTLGMRMREGRWIDEGDRFGTEPVIVLNEALARLLSPARSPVGECVRLRSDSVQCRRVVGVVRDTRLLGQIGEPAEPTFHLAFGQRWSPVLSPTVFVRLASEEAVTDAQLRDAVRRLDPSLSRPEIRRMRTHLAWQTRPYEVGRTTFTVFGLLAGVIAMIGLSGVLSYLVAQERNAYAVRIALGAPPARVVRPVLLRAVWLVAAGSALGVLLLVPWRERIDGMLFDTRIISAAPLALVVVVGMGVALVAALVPVRAVLRIQPMEVLREE